MSSSETQGSLIVSISDVQLAHLSGGVSTPLATGTLQLVNVIVGFPAPAATSDSSTPPSSVLLMTLQVPGETEPIFELVLAPESRILSEAPSSYIVPNYQPGASKSEQESSGSIKVTLPSTIITGTRETFEHVLWGMTSFASNSSTLSGEVQLPAYSPSTYGTAPSSPTLGATIITPSTNDLRSQLVLVDSNGNLVGTLADNVSLHEDASLAQEHQGQNEKEPVIVEASALTSSGPSGTSPGATTPTSGGGGHHFDFSVRPLSAFNHTPNPSSSTIITWGDYLSHGIIVGGDLVSRTLEFGADTLVSKRAATSKPLVFSETTKNRTAKTTAYSGQVVQVSNKAAKMVGDAAAKVGDRIGKATGIQSKTFLLRASCSTEALTRLASFFCPAQPSGKAPKGLKGLVNKSLVAFNTVLDATETTAKHLLVSGGQSSTKVIHHTLGTDAAQVSAHVGAGAQNVFLVYLDARGVSRRALLKGVGKGALRCKMQDGREVVLTDEEGGQAQTALLEKTSTSQKGALTKQ